VTCAAVKKVQRDSDPYGICQHGLDVSHCWRPSDAHFIIQSKGVTHAEKELSAGFTLREEKETVLEFDSLPSFFPSAFIYRKKHTIVLRRTPTIFGPHGQPGGQGGKGRERFESFSIH
jgi:hypothetical protein